MRVITGGGAFTYGNIRDLNANFAETQGIDLWVRPQVGSDNNVGTYDAPFRSLAGLAAVGALVPFVKIGVQGVLKENFVAPPVNDVSIIGVANQPRQATTSGTPNGGGATWMNPGTVAQALVEVGASNALKSQGWRFQNLFFGQAGAAPCMILNRTVAGSDSSHAAVLGCTFTAPGVAASIGISTGEILRLIVDDCQFYDFTGAGAYGMRANIAGGIANPPYLQWEITNSRFTNNVNNLVGALRNAVITNNSFMVLGRTQTTTISIGLTGGANNTVMDNNIGDNLTGAAASYTGGTNDAWCNKYRDDGFGSGVPS